MDALTVIVVVLTAYFKAGDWSKLGRFPWNVVIVGVIALFVRMLALSILSGTMLRLVGGVLSNLNTIVNTFTTSVTDADDQRAWPFANRLKASRRDRLRGADVSWYCLIALGVAALIVMVAGSGGVRDSPFRDILVATFILGQFRAPTAKGIWALFGFGVLAATATEALYSSLRHDHRFGLAHLTFPGSYYIAPGLLVGLVSTLVYYLTFMNEAKRRLNSPDTRSGA